MAQTPAQLVEDDGYSFDYTPASDVIAGQIVVINMVPYIAPLAIKANKLGRLEASGLWKIPKKTGAIAVGDSVFWDTTADPVTGTAGSGAATTAGNGNSYLGPAVDAPASGDSYVTVQRIPTGRAPRTPTATVAATGSAQGDAAAVKEGMTLVSAGDGTKGVILPAAEAGKRVEIKNGAAAILKIYPATADAINALSANAALSIAANTTVTLIAYDATTWYSFPLLPS